MKTIEERVRDGAAWLDQEHPGWVEKINLDTLNMRSGLNCIVGQTFETFTNKFNHHEDNIEEGENLGFLPLDHLADEQDEYDALEAAWRKLILERRAL